MWMDMKKKWSELFLIWGVKENAENSHQGSAGIQMSVVWSQDWVEAQQDWTLDHRPKGCLCIGGRVKSNQEQTRKTQIMTPA